MRLFFKKSSCLLAILLVSVTTSYSQMTFVPLTMDNSPTVVSFIVPFFNPLFGLPYINPDKTLFEVADGSQYMNDAFKKVKTASKDVKVEARYNAYFDEMEIKKQEKAPDWMDKEYHQNQILMTEDGIAYKILDAKADPEKDKLGFFQLMIKSNYVSLYKKNTKILVVGVDAGPYMTPPPEVVIEFQEIKTEYFIEFNNSGIAQRLPSTRRRIAKIFKQNKDLIIDYIKDNKLKVTRDADMVKIFVYINSLGQKKSAS
ncbi:MAG: hypothetical protein AAF611_20515 [Bacteroidota bacterium]